ncbi:MAG: hypothetical protein IT379_24895 [Deltaproteobacteria bacterium]|nr:hypothetical protein [Deltaproteobacteria bacterium]
MVEGLWRTLACLAVGAIASPFCASCGSASTRARQSDAAAAATARGAPSVRPATPAGRVIRWTRRPPIGTTWIERVRREVSRSEVTSGRGGDPRTETTRRGHSFEAMAEVLASDARREVVRYTVVRFTRDDAARSTDVVRPGTVLEIAREVGRGWVTRSGRPVDRRLLTDIADVLDIGFAPRGEDRDTLFGSGDEPREPGQRWSADVRAVAHLVAQPVERVEATVSLRERRVIDGVPCDVVAYTIAVSNRVVPDVPPELEVESASLRMDGEIALPTDVSLPPLRSSVLFREQHVLLGQTTGRRTTLTAEHRTTEERRMQSSRGVHAPDAAR